MKRRSNRTKIHKQAQQNRKSNTDKARWRRGEITHKELIEAKNKRHKERVKKAEQWMLGNLCRVEITDVKGGDLTINGGEK